MNVQNDSSLCETCQGHGYRIEVPDWPGQTLNVNAARDLGYMNGRRILCRQCQPAPETIKLPQATPEFRVKPKPKPKKKIVLVAGIKPAAYVDNAEA